jgi:hypothetical protein
VAKKKKAVKKRKAARPKKAGRPRRAPARRTPAKRAPPKRPTIFISYTHANPSTGIARKLYEALLAPAEAWGADLYMDEKDAEPAQLLDEHILEGLDRTTHFVALVSPQYWASRYCRMEITRVISKFEKDRESVRPCLVMAEKFNPADYTLDKDRKEGRIVSDDPLIMNLGNVIFLGPFNEVGQLVRLEWEHAWALSDQLSELVKSLGRIIHRK